MTCRDLITESLVEIGAYGSGETPSAEDMTLGLTRLQRLSDTLLTDAGTLTLDSDVPTPAEAGDCLMYELALRLCGPFGTQFTQEQNAARRRAKSRLLAALQTPANVDSEEALLFLTNLQTADLSFLTGE